jgi:endonuclease-3 related protein
LHKISETKLAQLIRPAGYFNVKAKRLKSFVDFLFQNYGGHIQRMKTKPLEQLRQELLNVKGIGPETADSMLLYALGYPSFVVDAYTKRVLYRHNIIAQDTDYHAVQKLFVDHLKLDGPFFNEYHALIVKLAKEYCRTRPDCAACPLKELNYSLKNKCGQCHRAFLPLEKRMPDKALQFVCVPCYDLAKL